MANDLSNPVNATVSANPAAHVSGDGFFDHGAGSDSLFGAVQLAQAEGGAAPAAPGQTIHVTPPQGAAGPVVIRVAVAPGSIVELPQPFDADAALAAKEGDGNLAIRVGDVTVILQGYIDAANDPQLPVTIEGADGKPIDIATVLASTDPAIDIQTAAGAEAGQGGQGADNTGAILTQLEGGAGLGGFDGVGGQDQTALGYSLIDASLRQEFAATLVSTNVFGFSVGALSGSFSESFLRDPAQTTPLGDFANFMTEYQDAVENPNNPMYPGWADFQGTNATGGDFAEYLDQTRKTVTIDANFTGASGDLVLNGIAPGVTSNGHTLYVDPADQGHTLFVRRDGDDALVAVVHVEGPDASGAFTIDTFMINRIDHPLGDTGDAGKDPMTIEVDFTVYDGPAPLQGGEGNDVPVTTPSIEGSFTASFDDDVPILDSVTYHNQHVEKVASRDSIAGPGDTVGLIDEDWLRGGAKDQDDDNGGDAGGGTCVTGCIKVDFGADGKAQSDSRTEAADKHAFVLDTATYHLGQPFPYQGGTLTSGGQTLVVLSVGPDHLTVGIADDKQQQVASRAIEGDETPTEPTDPIPGCTIFTLTLNQDTGAFEFNLSGPLDHGVQSDAIFGDETGVSALVAAGNIEETIPLQFTVRAYDDDKDYVDASIDIEVNDDVPIARDDHDHVEKGSFDAIYGDVITGYGEDSNAGIDSEGGDGAVVIGVAAGQLTADQTTGAGTVIQGTYGKLYLGADGGKYTYTRDPGTPGGGDDHFTYTLKDADGDTSTAVLTVHIDNACVTITLPDCPADTTVHESGLPARNGEPEGTDAAANSETTSGTITINAPDTINTLEIGGTTLTLAELNALTPGTPVTIQDGTRGELLLTGFDAGTGQLDYTYNLLDNALVSGDSTNASFAIAVKDLDGSEGDATLTIKIVDDEPTANCDTISLNATKQPTADVQFIFDVSGSMEDYHVSVPGYPDNGIGLERYAAAQMLAAHPEIQNVQIVLFSDHASHTVWMTATAALTYVQNSNNFNGGGATNYDLALTEAMNVYGGSTRPLPQGDQTLLYFFSDGGPNQPYNGAGIDGNGSGSNVSVAEWEAFVNTAAHDISNVFAVGVGSISPSELGQLLPISYPNTDTQAPLGREDNYLSIGSSNVTGLIQTLDHVIVPVVTPVTGDVTLNDVSGADGFGTGKLVSVAYEGSTLSFDATHQQQTIDLGAERGTLVINDDGTYTYTPPAGKADGTPFFVEYTVQDGDGDQSTAKLKIDINTAPEIDLNGGATGANNTASFIEQTPVLVAPAATVSDDDGVTQMTVSLTNRPDGNAVESLSLNSAADVARSGAGLSFSYNASTGVATITGPAASAAVYQTILQGILYNNTSDTPNTATRNVTVVVNDGTSDSVVHNIAVSVTPVNDAPTAVITPLSFNVNEQANLALQGKGLSIGDVDSGNDTMTVKLSVGEGELNVSAGNSGVDWISGNGTSKVTITGSVTEINNLLGGIDTGFGPAGTITYTNDSDTPSATTTLKLEVDDNGNNGIGPDQTASDTAIINIAALNDAPVACGDHVVTNAGSNLFNIPEWALVYNDSDADNSSLDLVSGAGAVLNSSGGSAGHPTDGVGNAGAVTFTDSGGNGGSFDYKVTDGSLTDTGHVTVTQDTNGTLSGSGNDDIVVVFGSTGTNVDAGGGDDIVIGGGGKDTLSGGSGNDLIFGQAGDDTMIFGSDDKYDGGDNFDRVRVDGSGTTVTYEAGKFLNVEMIDIGDANDRSGNANQNTLALNASDLGVHNYGSIGGMNISLFVIGDTNGSNSNNRDNVDLTGFHQESGISGKFTDGASGAEHTFNVWTSNANAAIHVAVEQNLDVV